MFKETYFRIWKQASENLTRWFDATMGQDLLVKVPSGICPQSSQDGVRISGSWTSDSWKISFGTIEILTPQHLIPFAEQSSTDRYSRVLSNPQGLSGTRTNEEIVSYVHTIEKKSGGSLLPADKDNIVEFRRRANVFGVTLEAPKAPEGTRSCSAPAPGGAN